MWLNAAESRATSLPLICSGSGGTFKMLKEHAGIFGKPHSRRRWSLLLTTLQLLFQSSSGCHFNPPFFSFKAWFLRIFLFPAFLFPSRAVAAHNIPSRAARVTSPCLHALDCLARRCAAGQVLMERYNFPSRSFCFLRFPLCSHYVSGVRSHWGRGNTLCLSSAFRKMPLLLCLYISVCACHPFCCLWSGVREHCRL